MSILEGLIAADKNKSVREEAALRKQAAERQNEEFGWRRDEQARAASERRAFEEERGRGLDMYGSTPQGNPFMERLGLAPQRAQMQPPTEMPQVEGVQPMAQMPQGQPGMPQQGFMQDPRWQALQQQMRLARTPEQMAAVHQGAQQFQQAQQRSGMYDAVMNATPDQMVQFSQKFSDFSPVRGKTDFDPKTGMTRLTLENGKPVMLNRAQMAQMVEGMHRMSQGDASGIQVLAGVNKDLAASAKEDFDRLVSVTNSGNDVAYKGNAMLNDNARTGIAAQGLKQRQAELDRPSFMEVQGANGEIGVVDRNKIKVDSNGLGLLPPGVKFKGQKPEMSFTKTDDGGVFMQGGQPVGKYDPQLGMVPFGFADPRADKGMQEKMAKAGVTLVSGNAGGRPAIGYVSPVNGKAYSTFEEAVSPPITQGDVGDLQGLQDYLVQSRAQLAAAARSGDAAAIQQYGQQVTGLQRTLSAAAKERFGARADEYLKTR